MKLTEKQLRDLIKETLTEMTVSQAQVEQPIKEFIAKMNQAKQALGPEGARKALVTLYQQAGDKHMAEQVEKLLKAIKQIDHAIDSVVGWLDNMPELTRDPWAHAVKRGL